MHESKRTPRLGALSLPGEHRDRFALGSVVEHHNARSGGLLAEQAGVEWGGRS